MTVKRVVQVLLSLVVVASMVLACAPAQAPTTAPEATKAPTAAPTTAPTVAPTKAPAQPVELTVWTRFPEMEKFLQDVGNQYTQANPNVKVTVTLFAQRALDDKIAVAWPEGEASDIVELGAVTAYPYYTQGFLEPVPADLADWLKQHVNKDMIEVGGDGVVYAVPFFTGIQALYYNKTYFEEAGLTRCPETLDELIDYATKLTKRDDKGNITVSGFGLRLAGGGFGVAEKFWALAMIPYGAKPVKKVDGGWLPGYDVENTSKAIQFYLDGVYKYKFDSPDVKHDSEGFGLGALAMFQRESWVIGTLAETAPDLKYGTCLMVKGPDGWGTGGAPSDLTVSKSSKNKEVAWDFIKLVMTPENQLKLLADTGWLPTRTDADYSSVIDKQPAFKAFLDSLSTPGYEVQSYAIIEPSVEIVGKMADALVPAFSDASLAEDPAAVKKIVEGMIETTKQVLSDYGILAE